MDGKGPQRGVHIWCVVLTMGVLTFYLTLGCIQDEPGFQYPWWVGSGPLGFWKGGEVLSQHKAWWHPQVICDALLHTICKHSACKLKEFTRVWSEFHVPSTIL